MSTIDRAEQKRSLVKILIAFGVIVFAFSTLYTHKPTHAPVIVSDRPKAPVELDSEQLIAQTPIRKQHIDIQAWRTPKGARVMFVQADEVPMLDIRLVFNAGAARDGNMPGLANLTNGLLNEGTATASVDDIARHFEGLGANLTLGSYRDMAIASLRTLSDPAYRDKALPMFCDIVSHPSFPDDAFERVRQHMLIGLNAEKQNPAATLNRTFFGQLYANHPYGIPPSGTEESLRAVTRQDVAAFHARYYVASNLVIAMTGAIDRATAESIAAAVDAALPAGEPAPAIPDPVALTSTQTLHVDFPSSQTHIAVGGLSVQRDTPDWAALYVGNEILGGGGFTSRLNQIIRQDNGLAYSVYSTVSPMAQEGPFMMGLQTRNENADKALALVRKTFDTFIQEGPTEQELAEARKNLLGGYPLTTANNQAIVDQLGAMAFYDLPLDHLETLPQKIAAVTVDDIRKAFASHIARQSFLTLTLGGTP